MKPVKQTKIHSETVRGNCFAACIASLMELPIDEVPNVEVLYCLEDKGFYWEVLIKWLEAKGYEIEWSDIFGTYPKDEFYMISGTSPRGIGHVCIFYNYEMVHDPHPENNGLIKHDHILTLRKI